MTEIIFILDKSGSMSGLEEDTIGGFNSMLKKQQKNEGEVLVSTVLFDDESKVLHDRVSLKDVKPLTEDDYVPGGCTALLDAVGGAIKHISNVHKYARPEDRPEKTLVIITTDGMENSSERYDYRKVKKMIDKKQEKHNWEFIFLGANIDAAKEAGRLGVAKEKAVNYCHDKEGTQDLYDAIGEYVTARVCCADEIVPDSSWREKLDEDYKKRGKK
ncbi:MAG: VWA domain-containing protein [Selenomonadaceae bacterium]|nr:VWA domain-containing protein [Selenomonadaceae bacterium]